MLMLKKKKKQLKSFGNEQQHSDYHRTNLYSLRWKWRRHLRMAFLGGWCPNCSVLVIYFSFHPPLRIVPSFFWKPLYQKILLYSMSHTSLYEHNCKVKLYTSNSEQQGKD